MTFILWFLSIMTLFIGGLNLMEVADTTLLTGIDTSIVYFVSILRGWNWLFAIDTLFICFLIVVGYEVSIWAWFNILAPLIKFIRGTSS